MNEIAKERWVLGITARASTPQTARQRRGAIRGARMIAEDPYPRFWNEDAKIVGLKWA